MNGMRYSISPLTLVAFLFGGLSTKIIEGTFKSDYADKKYKLSTANLDHSKIKEESAFGGYTVNKVSSTYTFAKDRQILNNSNVESFAQEDNKFRIPSGTNRRSQLNTELMDSNEQRLSFLRNLEFCNNELPGLDKGIKNYLVRDAERFESDFTYQSILPKTQLKPYLSPEFQSELKDVTEGHFFRQKLSGLKGGINDKHSLKMISGKGKITESEANDIKGLEQRTLNYAKIRSTDSSSTSTPINTSVQNYEAKGKAIAQGGSSSVGTRKLMKKGAQTTINDSSGTK